MHSRDFKDGTILLKAEPGEEVVSGLLAFLEKRRFYAGSLSAIGGAREAEIGFYDKKKGRYSKRILRGPLEILSLQGNVTRIENGAPFLHAHVILGDRRMGVRGGHLFRVVADPTCEVFLRPLPGRVERRQVPGTGLRLWHL